MKSLVLRMIIFFLLSASPSFGQDQVKISYQGFIDNAFNFFIKNVSQDTILITSPSVLFDYNQKIQCFEIDTNYYAYNANVVFIDYPFKVEKLNDYIADARTSEFQLSSSTHSILPGESYGIRLKPVNLKRKELKKSYIKLILKYHFGDAVHTAIYPW